MKQVRVSAVNGRKVQAAGKWLTTIGNRNISVGDLVWTDGKCVYGHQSDAGGSPTIIGSKPDEIPLLIGKYSASEGNQYGAYNPKKGVNIFRQGEKHDGLINTKSKFSLIDNNADANLHWEDVNMDVEGNIYGIDSGQTNQDGTYRADSPVRIYANGKYVSSFSMGELVEKTKADAIGRVAPDSGSSTQDLSIGGKIFSADDYWFIVHDVATAHKSIDYYPYLTPGSLVCYIVRRWLVTPAARVLIYEESVNYHGWPLDNWGWDCEFDYSPPRIREIRLPLGNGFYYILGGNPTPSISTYPHRGVSVFYLQYGGYTAYLYSPEDKLIATLSKETTGIDICASNNISVCKLGSDKYLIGVKGYGLFVAQKGELTSLDVKPYNWRLCPLKNMTSWKKEGSE